MGSKESPRLAFRPQKLLGQNFLSSPSHLAKIVEVCQLDNNANVVEVGAGYGALTRCILEANPQRLISIEKDPKLFCWLNANLSSYGKVLRFLLADALAVEWEQLLEQPLASQQKSIVVGNLPYNIANQLVSKLVRKQHFFKRLVFLVQKEVAQRWVANHLSYKSKYSSLSIILNYFCKAELVFTVPRHFFKPQPPVDGAVVSFEFREDLPVGFPTESFLTFARGCFRFRRKTLLNNLKGFRAKEPVVRDVFTKLDLQEKVRPQDLSTEQYLKLFEAFRSL